MSKTIRYAVCCVLYLCVALLLAGAAKATDSRMRAGFPHGACFADKCSTSYSLEGEVAAFNDSGIITCLNGRAVIVADFLNVLQADKKARSAHFFDIAKSVADTCLVLPQAH